jgi:predicted short-subunit dehydrogenase-like oxidoreductase (DUF2520 family)
VADADILSRSLVLAGPGRAGRAFARSWVGAGGRIARVIARDPLRVPAEDFAGALVETEIGPPIEGELLVVAVSDDAIAATAARLAGRLTPRFAFHLSGALESTVLAPFRERGAQLASMHPVRPFTGSPDELWKDAFVAVEGDEDASAAAESIARSVGARPHRIRAADKPLYHAAASLAAGGAAAVLSVAVRGWSSAGIPEDLAREALSGLASRAVSAVARRDFADGLTGAVARRDVGTVRRHARALGELPGALALYRLLAEEMLARTPGRGREEEIRAALRAPQTGG